MRRLLLAAVLATVLTGVLQSASAVPTYGARDGGPSFLLSNADGRSPYSGIVRYHGRATCTGVFLDTIREGEDPGDAPAYVVTNGHCPDFPGPNVVIVDRAVTGHRVIFNYFIDTQARQVTVPVARLAYATMKGQDVAVLELAARYADVVEAGFAPWRPTLTLPDRHEPVVVVGAPLQFTPATAFLRLAACQLDGRAQAVVEWRWHWYGFDRNLCADIQSGSSGSPVISRVTGRVLGLVNTTTVGGRPPYTECALDHPCEPVTKAEEGREETTYATPLVRMDRCFDEAGYFDVHGGGCPLDPGEQLSASPTYVGWVNPLLASVPIGQPVRRWNVRVSGSASMYRYKVAAAPAQDCRDLRGYGPVRRVNDRPLIDDALPGVDGWHLLCVIAGNESRWGDGWQATEFATVVVARVDTVPPRIEAPLTIEESELAWRVTFVGQEPEISTYTYKFGRPSETSCSEPSGYRLALVPFISLPKSGRPYVFCAIPYDSALNPGRTVVQLLP